MRSNYPRIIIAGVRGGAGKTAVSLGIIASWKQQGRAVVTFKKGPDYIDAGWLSAAAGHPCYNLDPFLIPQKKIMASFLGHYGKADCAVIEGNRGLYDGMDASGTYSTAELAKALHTPVILVMDCTKVTRTAAAMLLGMLKFDPKVKICGVVLNRIAGSRHEMVIREAIEKYCGVPVVGAIPKLRGGQLSERHMGLTPFQEHPGVNETIRAVAGIAAKYLDLGKVWQLAEAASPLSSGQKVEGKRRKTKDVSSPALCLAPVVRIGIIRDSAFQFYYPENFEELEKRGALLVEISALTARKLPDVDALYIGGGFPETHAIALAKNRAFRTSVKKAVLQGLPVYAECGGLMYLGEELVLDNKTYPMAGIFPLRFSLEKKPQAHGYTVVKVDRENPFYEKGTVLKGHEFHYSAVRPSRRTPDMRFAFSMERGEGITGRRDGICFKNVLATYTHIHALGSPEWAEGMVKRAMEYKRGRS
ncbi:MAG: cobyrinate a,c-diamide synthase [Nitrospirae bacterium]|nr:cobyrinate a,c-diamide synthase [Nitrospirota bacterium]